MSSVFFAPLLSDWSVKMRLCRFPAMGHEQELAKIFDPHLERRGGAAEKGAAGGAICPRATEC